MYFILSCESRGSFLKLQAESLRRLKGVPILSREEWNDEEISGKSLTLVFPLPDHIGIFDLIRRGKWRGGGPFLQGGDISRELLKNKWEVLMGSGMLGDFLKAPGSPGSFGMCLKTGKLEPPGLPGGIYFRRLPRLYLRSWTKFRMTERLPRFACNDGVLPSDLYWCNDACEK